MSNKKAYLKEMGIDVWVERTPASIEPTPIPETAIANESLAPKVKVVETAPVEAENSEISKKINITELDWQALNLHASQCQLCDLSKTRTQTNFGAGNQTASLMIIADEMNNQADSLLTSMLRAMGYQRNDVYLSNIVKCNLPENKEVVDEQVEACEPYLQRQIELIQPKVILALGNAVAQRLLKSKSAMNRLRGQLHYIDGLNCPVLVTYHPTYLLAAPNEKRKAWQDLQLVMKELKI